MPDMLEQGYPINTQVSFEEAGKQLSKQRLYLYIAERRKPRNPNFDIEVENGGLKNSVRLIRHETEDSVLLNDFLPSGASFGPIGFSYSIKRKIAGYESAQSLQAGAHMLSLLHEAGHAHFFAGILDEIPESLSTEQASDLISDLVESISPDLTRDELIHIFKQLDAIESISGLHNWDRFYEQNSGERLQEWLKEDFFIYHSAEERSCWAYALHTARDLEARGFNVTNGFKDVYDIFRFVNSALGSYEEGRWMSHRYQAKAEQPTMYTSRYIRLK